MKKKIYLFYLFILTFFITNSNAVFFEPTTHTEDFSSSWANSVSWSPKKIYLDNRSINVRNIVSMSEVLDFEIVNNTKEADILWIQEFLKLLKDLT